MNRFGFLIAVVFIFQSVAIVPVFAQAADRSYFVRADGDDDDNNRRSEDAPYKTLTKVVEMASKGAVKKSLLLEHYMVLVKRTL